MENTQKIEQLVSKAGCSYEEARTALEACGWDMLDAIISLEREGKVNTEESGTAVQYAEESAEEPVEVVPEVSADQIDGEYSSKVTYRYEGKDGAQDSGNAGKDAPKREFRLFKRIKGILMNNRMIIIKSSFFLSQSKIGTLAVHLGMIFLQKNHFFKNSVF